MEKKQGRNLKIKIKSRRTDLIVIMIFVCAIVLNTNCIHNFWSYFLYFVLCRMIYIISLQFNSAVHYSIFIIHSRNLNSTKISSQQLAGLNTACSTNYVFLFNKFCFNFRIINFKRRTNFH